MAVDTLHPNPDAAPAEAPVAKVPSATDDDGDVTEDIFGATQTIHTKGPAHDAESLKRFDLFTCNFRNVPELFRLALTSAHTKLEDTRRAQGNLAQEISRLDNNVRKTQARQVKQLDSFREHLADFERRIVHFERTAGSRRRTRRLPTRSNLSESFQGGCPVSPTRGPRDAFAGGNSPRRASNTGNSNTNSTSNNNPTFGIGITGNGAAVGSNIPAPMTKAPAIPSVMVRRGSQSSPNPIGQARQDEDDQGKRGRKELGTKPVGRGANRDHAKTANLAAFVGGFIKSSGSAGGSSSNRSSRQSSRGSSLAPQDRPKETPAGPPAQHGRQSRAPALGDVDSMFHDAVDLERLDEDSVDSVVMLVSDAEQRLGDRIAPLEQGLGETQESLHNTADEVDLLRERVSNIAKEVKALHNQLPKQTSEERIQGIAWTWVKSAFPPWLKTIGGLKDGTAEAFAAALKKAVKPDSEPINAVRAELMKEVEQQAESMRDVVGRVTALEEEVFIETASSAESGESERRRADEELQEDAEEAEEEEEEREDEEEDEEAAKEAAEGEVKDLREQQHAPEERLLRSALTLTEDPQSSDREGAKRASVVKFSMDADDPTTGDLGEVAPRGQKSLANNADKGQEGALAESDDVDKRPDSAGPPRADSGIEAGTPAKGLETSANEDQSDVAKQEAQPSPDAALPSIPQAIAEGDMTEATKPGSTKEEGEEVLEDPGLDAMDTGASASRAADRENDGARPQSSKSDWKKQKSRSRAKMSASSLTLGGDEMLASEEDDKDGRSSDTGQGTGAVAQDQPEKQARDSTADPEDDFQQRASTTSRASGSRTPRSPRTPRGSRWHLRRSRSRASKADEGGRHDRDFGDDQARGTVEWRDSLYDELDDEDDGRSSGLGPLASGGRSPRRRAPLNPGLFLSEDSTGGAVSGGHSLNLLGLTTTDTPARTDEAPQSPSKRRGLSSTVPVGDLRGLRSPRKMMGSGAITPGSHRRGIGSLSGSLGMPFMHDAKQRKGIHHFEQVVAGHEEILSEMKKDHEHFKKTITDLESAGLNSGEYQAELKRVENEIRSQLHGNLRVLGEKMATMDEKVGTCLKAFQEYQGQVSSRLAKGKTEVDIMSAELKQVADTAANSVEEVLKSLAEERGRYAEQLGIIFPRALEDKERKGQMSITEARMFGLDSRLDALEKQVWQGARGSLKGAASGFGGGGGVDGLPPSSEERLMGRRGHRSKFKSTAATVQAVCTLNVHTPGPGTRKGYKDGMPFLLDQSGALEMQAGGPPSAREARQALNKAKEAMGLLQVDESLSGSDSDRQGQPKDRAGGKGSIGWMLRHGQGMIAAALAVPPAAEDLEEEDVGEGQRSTRVLAFMEDLTGATVSTQSLMPSRVKLPTRQVREDSPVTLPTPAVPSTLTTSRLGCQQLQSPELPLSVNGRNGSGRRPSSSGSARQRPKAIQPKHQSAAAPATAQSSTSPAAAASAQASPAAGSREATLNPASVADSAKPSVSLPKAAAAAPAVAGAAASEVAGAVQKAAAGAGAGTTAASAGNAAGAAAATATATAQMSAPSSGSATARGARSKAVASTAMSTHEVQSRLAKGCPSSWHPVS